MPRTRVFTRMVGADAKYQPAVRIEFKGKYQSDYFSLKKFAEEDFGTTQTALARLIISDKMKEWREKKKEAKPIAMQQMVMILAAEREKAAKRPKKKEKAE